jgi:hypothetical protein
MTEPKIEKIKPSVMRALQAVERGEVFKKIGRRNSKMEGPKGVGSASLWTCVWAKLVEDGSKSGAMNVRYQQVLTDAGRKALETGECIP